jgi:hypothetical protein
MRDPEGGGDASGSILVYEAGRSRSRIDRGGLMMRFQLKSVALGFVLAGLVGVLTLAVLFLVAGGESRPVFHERALSTGQAVKITAVNLVWGVDHDERRPQDDSFQINYVLSAPLQDSAAIDRETVAVFELIRPVSEQWGFPRATVCAFPAVERKGTYHIYAFARGPDGRWTFERHQAKVHIND